MPVLLVADRVPSLRRSRRRECPTDGNVRHVRCCRAPCPPWFGGVWTTSPARISWTLPPHPCTQPVPSVTIRFARAGANATLSGPPGPNVTLATATREGSLAGNSRSTPAEPVKKPPG